MPRPKKCRKVCALPQYAEFGPAVICDKQAVEMAVDEYETIRLIDLEGLTQEQCAQQMEVARTTVQAIYASARRKMAECIVHGRRMIISGGEIRICRRRAGACGCSRAARGVATCNFLKEEDESNE